MMQSVSFSRLVPTVPEHMLDVMSQQGLQLLAWTWDMHAKQSLLLMAEVASTQAMCRLGMQTL